jgi:hypothetical protein
MVKYTPENIEELGPDDVFVYGANLAWIHGAGAAKLAEKRFGAVRGYGPFNGRSYGIPTKDMSIETLPYENIRKHVNDFILFAKQSPERTFYVTKIGCGLAGYDVKDIAPLFYDVPNNVILPKEFASDLYEERYEQN